MNIKITLVTAGMVLALPIANAAVEVPPNQSIPRIKLGGHASIKTNQLELISKRLAACTSPAFTEAELARVAPAGAITRVVTTARNGRPIVTRSVTLPARNDKRARTVPIGIYLQEINAAEKFFNQHGYTLRHGALSRRPQGRPDPLQRGVCAERPNVAGARDAATPLIRYRLTDAPDGPVKGNVLDHRVELEITKPNPPGPGDVMGIFQPHVSLIKHPELTKIGKQLMNPNLVEIPKFKGARGMPAQKVTSGCPKVCTLELNKDTTLTPAAQELLANPHKVILEKYSCRIDNLSGNNAAQCPPIHKLHIGSVTQAQYWTDYIDVQFFLDNWKTPCAVIANETKMGAKGNPELLYAYSEQSKGNQEIAVGLPAKTFFDGKLLFKNSGIADCVLDIGSNSLFGAQFCLKYNTANEFSPSAGFKVHNDAGIKTDVSLFGYTFDLVSGSANIDWNQPVSQTVSLPVVQPVITTTLQQSEETQHFEGPGATFPIGPVPLTVRTFADASLTVGKPDPVFVAPPLVNGSGLTGKVGMKVGAGTDVSLGMDAAVDAFVLSAGVSGKMSLLNNNLTGGITSLIAPAKNEVTVEKAYTFDATTLKGSISAFVEIDLLIYSERYSVEIISFPGKTHTWPLDVSTWGPAKAVIPESFAPAPVCK